VYHGVATPVKVVNGQWAMGNEKNSPFTVHHSRKNLFEGLPEQFEVGRYHSWVVSREDFPEELEITAEDDNGYIMGLQHKTYDVQGVQFHPESVLTPKGEDIMRNWLKQ
jgi:anthranilate synthase component 2